nr:hypothetical protein Iba_chr15aCG6490 [Ipomoea batatas]GMD99666.1 hypothetical protein Iba_chr15eCG6040 [Ipomoea batatas]
MHYKVLLIVNYYTFSCWSAPYLRACFPNSTSSMADQADGVGMAIDGGFSDMKKESQGGVQLGVQSLRNDSVSQCGDVAALLHGHRRHGVLNHVGDERDLLHGADGLQRHRWSFGVRRSHGRQQGRLHRTLRMGVFLLRLWHVCKDQESAAGDRNLKWLNPGAAEDGDRREYSRGNRTRNIIYDIHN